MESKLPFIYSNVGVDYDERVLPSITTEVLKAVVVRKWSYLAWLNVVSLCYPKFRLSLMPVNSSPSEKWWVGGRCRKKKGRGGCVLADCRFLSVWMSCLLRGQKRLDWFWMIFQLWVECKYCTTISAFNGFVTLKVFFYAVWFPIKPFWVMAWPLIA